MFINVGRFVFRPMGEDERKSLMQRMEQDVPPMARESHGFRGVYFARSSDDELMTVWLWDSEADWGRRWRGSDLCCKNTSSLTWLRLPSVVAARWS